MQMAAPELTDLSKESLSGQRFGHIGTDHLERDVPVVLEVAREIDGGHSTLAELPLDQVPVSQGGLQSFGRGGHSGEDARG
jgi:hypothetical protein